jgi:hypothetical protein
MKSRSIVFRMWAWVDGIQTGQSHLNSEHVVPIDILGRSPNQYFASYIRALFVDSLDQSKWRQSAVSLSIRINLLLSPKSRSELSVVQHFKFLFPFKVISAILLSSSCRA